MNKTLAIIPARGGSKRVKDKNIRILDNKPLIVYTIEAALKSKMIDRLIVSTEDSQIARIAKDSGAEVPFLRPSRLAKDNVPDQPVLLHALESLYSLERYHPDIIVNLRPTSPFKTPKTINKVITEFNNSEIDLVKTMTKTEGVHHPYWMYKINKNDYANQFVKKININAYYQSQKLPDIYRLNGLVDIYKRESIYKNKILNGKMITLVTSDSISHDIDTISDFKFAESLTKK